MPKHPGRSAILSSMTVDFPLLYSIVAVSLAMITEISLTLSLSPFSLGSIVISLLALVMLLLSLLYAVYELFIAVKLALQNRSIATGVCVSAFLGSLLLGIIAFVPAILAIHDFMLAEMAFVIIIFALIGLIFFLSSETPTVPVEQSFQQRGDVYPRLPELPLQTESGAVFQDIVTIQRRPQVRREDLPPLFQHDRLYSTPQPRAAQFFDVVKEGEDACVISHDETRFALCDGAGGSSLPRPWAALLGQQWIKEPLGENYRTRLSSWLEEPRQQWAKWVQETWQLAVNKRNQLTGDHPVRQEEVAGILERGASATLLGVEVHRQQHKWSALALGDTCLFVVRPSSSWQIITSMPMKKSSDFNLTPPLLSSQRGASVDELLPYVKYYSGIYQKGDLLVMATDALAEWLLRQNELGNTTWKELLLINDQQRFTRYIEQKRNEDFMEEDDTTLVIIRL